MGGWIRANTLGFPTERPGEWVQFPRAKGPMAGWERSLAISDEFSDYLGVTQIFRKKTGLPWPCRKKGPPVGPSGRPFPGVLVLSSRFS